MNRDPRPIPPMHSLTISVVCLVLALICLGFILAGCSLKSQQIAHVGLHAADLGSTAYAESHGASEANPVMASSNWPVRIALKSAATVTVLYVTQKLSKEHAGIAKASLMALNAVLAGVTINNMAIALRSQRSPQRAR